MRAPKPILGDFPAEPGGRSRGVAIEARALTKTYDPAREAITALAGIEFTVAEGEFVAVVGPSGCGKSTLLKILAGLLRSSSGEVTLRGEPITGPRRDIGVVFQSPVLFPWRSVADNVMLPVQVQGLERSLYRPRAEELLKLVGLAGFERRFPWELSGGMQQRVALVRGLVHDPAMLLMDEPFGALDAMTRETMNLETQRIWLEKRKTVLFITHSIPEAVFLADRVFVMTPRPGRLMRITQVTLPRPRTLDMVTTPAFGEFVREIRSCFNAHSAIGG